LGEIALLGAFVVTEAGRPPYFQLRCAARITRLDPSPADPAKGKTLVRKMLPAAQFMEVVAIEDYRPMLTSALRWVERHPAHSGSASTDEKVSGVKNPSLPGSRGFSSGFSARPGSAAPRPRRRAGLG
jgi:hypothetical protein